MMIRESRFSAGNFFLDSGRENQDGSVARREGARRAKSFPKHVRDERPGGGGAEGRGMEDHRHPWRNSPTIKVKFTPVAIMLVIQIQFPDLSVSFAPRLVAMRFNEGMLRRAGRGLPNALALTAGGDSG